MNRTENKGQMDRSDIHIDWASWKLEQIIQANKKNISRSTENNRMIWILYEFYTYL